MRSVRVLARSLAPHARLGRLAAYMLDLPAKRLVTPGTIAAELGEDADWVMGRLRDWLDAGWVIREPSDSGMSGYRATEHFPVVTDTDQPEAALWAAVLSAAITLDRIARQP